MNFIGQIAAVQWMYTNQRNRCCLGRPDWRVNTLPARSDEATAVSLVGVHHPEWLGSTSTDVGRNETRYFSIINEMEKIIKQPTRLHDRHDHAANILDLCFTSNPCNYS